MKPDWYGSKGETPMPRLRHEEREIIHVSKFIKASDLRPLPDPPEYNPPKILRNRAQCLRCGDIIESGARHDLQVCSCGRLAVDGGHDYIRRIFGQGMLQKDWKELSEYAER